MKRSTNYQKIMLECRDYVYLLYVYINADSSSHDWLLESQIHRMQTTIAIMTGFYYFHV